MESESNFESSDNSNLKELQENFENDLPITAVAETENFHGKETYMLFFDVDQAIDKFDEITDKFPQLEIIYNSLKEKNPKYREQWLKSRAVEHFLKEGYFQKQLEKFSWGKTESTNTPDSLVVAIKSDQEHLRDSMWLASDLFEPLNELRIQDFSWLFSVRDSSGKLKEYKKTFVSTLGNLGKDVQFEVWKQIVNGCKYFEKQIGRNVDLPQSFDEAYKLFVQSN